MKLIGFTTWSDDRYQEIEDQIEEEQAEEVTIKYMKEHGYRFTGIYHQKGDFGTPYFDTDQKLCLSFRGWGALMAKVLDLPEEVNNDLGLDMSYCYWAWYADNNECVLPDNKVNITIEIDEALFCEVQTFCSEHGTTVEQLTTDFIHFCAIPENYDKVRKLLFGCEIT